MRESLQGPLHELEIFEVFDLTPGAAPSDDEEDATSQRLRRFAREAEALAGKNDAKLQKAIELIGKLVKEGFNPIIFCRLIDTADSSLPHCAMRSKTSK